MPLYEYYCSDCNETFDVLRPMSQADDPSQCVECSGEHTSRVLSMFFAQSASSGSSAIGNAALQMNGGGGCCSGGACACGSSLSAN